MAKSKASAQFNAYFESIQNAAKYIVSKVGPDYKPTHGIILGSGLSDVASGITDKVAISYADIPGFPQTNVAGHHGVFVAGKIGNKFVACLQGRFHLYEGVDPRQSVIHVYVLKALGCETVILTNASGGVNKNFRVGDIMLITDHISFPALSGKSPLFGPNDERLGERFPSMVGVYSKRLRNLADSVSVSLKLCTFIRQGVYCNVGGPQYESPAEIRMLRVLGADAVGMSTVNEAIAAKHCGLEVFGMALITNACISDADSSSHPSHKEVLDVSNKRAQQMAEFITSIIKQC